MSRNWEVCRPGFKPGRWQAPQATMDKRGVIKISRVAWELLGSYAHAIVLFDRESQTIGLQPQNAAIADTQPFIESGRHGARTVDVSGLWAATPRRESSAARGYRSPHSGGGAVTEYGGSGFITRPTETLRFVNPMLNEDGILELSLTTARPAYHGHRIGAYHNERKQKLARRRPPRPNWLGDTIND